MVRFGSPDLRTSALGVKRVRGSVSPWSRGRPKPKKAPNCQNSKICFRLQMGQTWVVAPLLKSRSPLKVDRMRHGSTQPRKSSKNGPIWVRRPPDKCTGGETGPRKRFPLVPRPSEAKKGPKRQKSQNLPPLTNWSKMGPITTDFGETRWDLIPPMRPRSSGGSRVKKSKVDIYF